MLRSNTPRVPIIPKLKFQISSSSLGSDQSELNYEGITEICSKLEKIISEINPNTEINKRVINLLKNSILNIYKLINEKIQNTNKIIQNLKNPGEYYATYSTESSSS